MKQCIAGENLDTIFCQVGGYCATSNMKLVIKVVPPTLSPSLSPLPIFFYQPPSTFNHSPFTQVGERAKIKTAEEDKKVVGKGGKVGLKTETEGRDGRQAQVLESQELYLLKRKDSQEDQQPVERMSWPEVRVQKEQLLLKEGKTKEEVEEKGKAAENRDKKRNGMGSGIRNKQKQEEPSLLAILRSVTKCFFKAVTITILREYRLASSGDVSHVTKMLLFFQIAVGQFIAKD